jgi:molecular chaperone GrpE
MSDHHIPTTSRPTTSRDRASVLEAQVAELDAKAAQLEARAAELEDNWRRALADLDNLRKRVAREAGQHRADERAQVVASLLPVIDHLELALAHADADPAAIIEGVRAVRDQAVAVMSALGFERSGRIGEPFDPTRHEAVGTVAEPTATPGTVAKVVRPGYGEGERQLRPAAVVVATRGEQTDAHTRGENTRNR